MFGAWMRNSSEARANLDVASGPYTPGHSSPGLTDWRVAPGGLDPAHPHPLDDLGVDDGQGDQEPWWESEIEMLKGNLKALNQQLFQERKQWLVEKTELESKASAAAGGIVGALHPGLSLATANGHGVGGRDGSFSSHGSLVPHSISVAGSTSGRRSTLGALERSPALDRSGTGLTQAPATDDPAALRAQVQALQVALATACGERDGAREELAVVRAEAQRWNVERAALQREVDVLRSSAGRGRASADGDEALATLEEERAALATELELIKQSLKNNVLVPKSHMAQLQSSAGGAALASGASQGGTGTPTRTPIPPSSSSGSIAHISGPNGTMREQDPQTVIAKLNAEITRLQADLFILKDECVPVPKAEFALLKGVHSEKVGMEQELRATKQELADVMRLNKMLQEEIELIKEEHLAITVQEYDELRRAAAEKEALELKVQAQAKYYTQVPKEELAEMQGARRSVAALEARVAAMQAVVAMSTDDTASALQKASHELVELRIQMRERDLDMADLRKEVQAGEGRAAVISDLQEKLRAAEAAMQTVQQEKVRLQLRLRSLEGEVEAAKAVMKVAQAESTRLALELGKNKDQSSAQAQEVSQLSRERGELEARVAELKKDHAALTNELVDAKLELARLREMEVLYKKSVLKTKKELYGLPSSTPDND